MSDFCSTDQHKSSEQLSQASDSVWSETDDEDTELQHNYDLATNFVPTVTPSSNIYNVYCSNKCGQVLDITALEYHLVNDCPLKLVDCKFKHVGCNVRLTEADMETHLTQAVVYHLSKQSALYEDRLKAIEADNVRLSEKCHRLESELEELKRRLSTLERHDVREIGNILWGKNQTKMKVNDGTPELNSQSQEVRFSSYVFAVKPNKHFWKSTLKLREPTLLPVNVTMTNFEEHLKSNKHWVSQGFYTHTNGYKMCLRVTPNGQCTGKDTYYVIIGVYLLKGEFDTELLWPFCGDITIQLLSQAGDDVHHTRTVYGARTEREIMTKLNGSGEQIIKAWRLSEFISHSDLCPKYLRNDRLKFQIFTILKPSELYPQELVTDV